MTDPSVIYVAEHRAAIDRVLAHYGLAPETLQLVPSVFEWCRRNAVPEDDDVGCLAKSFCTETGECRIVMRESFSRREFGNVTFAMEFRGFLDEVRRLKSLKLDLLHLLLSEIACHTLRTTERGPREAWAFSELAKHDI